MLLKIILLTALMGCVTIPETKKPTVPLRYAVGECALLVDPETGKYHKDDIMKVEAITDTYYVYRWWLGKQGWAIDNSTVYYNTGKRIGAFETFHKITRKVECPKDEYI